MRWNVASRLVAERVDRHAARTSRRRPPSPVPRVASHAEVAVGVEARRLPVLGVQRGQLLDDVGGRGPRCRRPSGVGNRQPRRLEVFEHHHVAVAVGVGEPRARDAHRAPRTRGRGRSAPRRRPCRPTSRTRVGVSSNGASFTNTVAGHAGLARAARTARGPVVPECRSSSSALSTSRSNAYEKKSGVRSSTSSGSTGATLRTPTSLRAVAATREPPGRAREATGRHGDRVVLRDRSRPRCPTLGEGEALLEVRYLGIDPTIRGWLNERGNYMAGVAIGEPVRSNGVGVVVETNNPDEYPLGRAFMHLTGWQQYCVVQSNPFPPITMLPEDVELIDVLGVLGHIGITAYVGVLEVAQPATGRDVLRLGRGEQRRVDRGPDRQARRARRVIGIAGSPEKCAWVDRRARLRRVHRLQARRRRGAAQGARARRRRHVLRQRRRRAARHRAAPDRDAGAHRAVRRHLDLQPRRPAAAVAQHALPHGPAGAHGGLQHARPLGPVRGRGGAARASGSADGTIKHRVHVLDGLDRAPEALVRLFTGDHLGKLVVRVSLGSEPSEEGTA